jgi:ATP-dependent RNA helicase HelY
MTCHLGDFREYSSLRRELADLERKNARAEGRTAGEHERRGDRDRRQRQIADLRKRMKQHPCHACAEREAHARWAERWWRLKRDTDQLRSQISGRTGAVAQIFDRVTDVLLELGYVAGEGELEVTASGRVLMRIYGERDLLVSECLRRGVWDDLDPAGLAALASALVYEPRREGSDLDYRIPRGAFRAALEATEAVWAELSALELANRLPEGTAPSPGIALATQRWAQGAALDVVLRDAELAAGDFVRWMKQAVDLLDQISLVADGPLGRRARQAIDGIRRGIVAYSGVS